MESMNPFNDPEFKKQILKKEGKFGSSSVPDEPEDLSVEVLQPDTVESDVLNDIIASKPIIPNKVKNLIADASALALTDREKKVQEMNLALNDVFTEYNKTYGMDLAIDFTSLSNTLVNVADPKTRHTLELYVSEVFKGIRPVLLLHLISRLSIAIDYITAPERMFDQNQLSLPDLFLVVEKLMSYIQSLDEIAKTTTVKDSDKLLERLAQERGNEDLNSDESKKAVDEFMKLFNREHGIG